MNKYSTKRTSSNCNSFDYSKHRRDYSPNRRSHSRNSSPDSWSPRGPSSYSSKSYSRKNKDCDRDSKYYDGSSKSKYIRLSRSPIGHESSKSYKSIKSSGHSRDSYYENNHSSYSSKRPHFGDWTEQTSSSGKRYFYNCKTEISQWEKPKDWADWEKRHSSKYSSSSDKYSNHYRDKYDISSNNPKSYSYTNDSISSSREKNNLYSTRHGSPHTRSRKSRSRDNDKRTFSDEKKPKAESNDYQYKKGDSSACPLKSTDSQCNILNNHNSLKNEKESPKLILNNNNNNNNNINNCNLNKSVEFVNITGSSSSQTDSNLSSNLLTTLASIVSSGQSSLNLSKLFSQLTNSHGINLSNLSQDETLNLLKKALQLTQKSHLQTNQLHPTSRTVTTAFNSPRNSTPVNHQVTNSPSTLQSKHHSNKSYSFSNFRHLNSADGIRQDLDQLSKNLIQSPTSSSSASESKSVFPNNRNDNTTSGLSTISVMNSSVTQKSALPNLPRFKHLYREDLVSHVLSWNFEPLEKQANMFFDQANHIGNNLCTRVSAELKSARSLVRLTEIRTTLQKQRILFASQQIKNVEEWKGKQVSNYS